MLEGFELNDLKELAEGFRDRIAGRMAATTFFTAWRAASRSRQRPDTDGEEYHGDPPVL